MGAKVSAFKKEVGEILEKLFSKLTPKQGKSVSLIIPAIVALLFLCTTTGRSVIVFVGYLIFVCGILLFAYKFFNFASAHSVAAPKPKKVKVDQGDNASDALGASDGDSSIIGDTVDADAKQDSFENEVTDEKEHQMTIEELVQEEEDKRD